MHVLTTLVLLAQLAAAPSVPCPPVEPEKFWLPGDQEHARKRFNEKAQRLNEEGLCIVDGWFGRNDKKFYFTIVPHGAERIGKVISFTYDELSR